MKRYSISHITRLWLRMSQSHNATMTAVAGGGGGDDHDDDDADKQNDKRTR